MTTTGSTGHKTMFRIWKHFRFSASHQLTGLPDDHQCSRLHGHNYTIEVEFKGGGVDSTGFVIDFGRLGIIKTYLDTTLDHRHLNDVLTFNPTAELMAKHLYAVFQEFFKDEVVVSAVRVQETESSWAEYSEGQ